MIFIISRSVGGRYVIRLGQTVSSLDWDSSNTEVLCEVDKSKKTRLNDAKCDTSGRLWMGDKLLYLIQGGSEKMSHWIKCNSSTTDCVFSTRTAGFTG